MARIVSNFRLLRHPVQTRLHHANTIPPGYKPRKWLPPDKVWPDGKPNSRELLEPDFTVVKELPEYPLVTIRFRGYDFVVLERFQKYAARTAKRFGAKLKESWASPAQHQTVTVLKPYTTIVDSEFSLSKYERCLQFEDMSSTLAPLLTDVLNTDLPEGVEMVIKEHEWLDEENRYIPDIELEETRAELESLDDPRVRKKLNYADKSVDV